MDALALGFMDEMALFGFATTMLFALIFVVLFVTSAVVHGIVNRDKIIAKQNEAQETEELKVRVERAELLKRLKEIEGR